MNFIYILINSDYHQIFVNAVKSKSSLDSDNELLTRLTNYGKNLK